MKRIGFIIFILTGCLFGIMNVHAEATVVDLSTQAASSSQGLEVDQGEAFPGRSMSNHNESMEQTVMRLEHQITNLTEMNLASKLEKMQQEFQQLRGQLELQSHDLAQMKEQQRNFYQDLDQRLAKLQSTSTSHSGSAANEKTKTAASSVGQDKSADAVDSDNNSQKELHAYEEAFNLLNKKQYDKAIAAFQSFIKSYPDSNYVVNAHYWVGEIFYLKAKPEQATKEFQVIISQYPSSQKVPDAMLKVALIAMDLGNYSKAKQHLLKIQKQFPGTTAAKVATLRLKEIKTKTA